MYYAGKIKPYSVVEKIGAIGKCESKTYKILLPNSDHFFKSVSVETHN